MRGVVTLVATVLTTLSLTVLVPAAGAPAPRPHGHTVRVVGPLLVALSKMDRTKPHWTDV